MQVRYIASACVEIEHQGVRILCDPWLTDGIYYGSWFHYPPLQFEPEQFADVDYLYISHIHPDHMDAQTLQRLPRSIPILIHDYEEKFLLKNLQRLGFESIQEVPHGESVSLGKDFSAEIFAADNCNPAVCGRFFGCAVPLDYKKTMQIDSLAVFRGGGKVVVNTNDCPYGLAHAVCDQIRERTPQVDFLLVGYNGAGEYPQCFDDMTEEQKQAQAEVKRRQFLNQGMSFIRHLQPKAFMPFAGQYLLGGPLSKLNRYKGVTELETLPDEFARLSRENQNSSQCILLNPGERYDVDMGKASAPFAPPDPKEREQYITQVLEPKGLPYEEQSQQPASDFLLDQIKEAHNRLWRNQQKFGYQSDWTVYLDIGEPELFSVCFDGSEPMQVHRGQEREPFVRIGLDRSLLGMILNRKAHWNNAAIGSHLRLTRQPDRYERAVYELLSYLHC